MDVFYKMSERDKQTPEFRRNKRSHETDDSLSNEPTNKKKKSVVKQRYKAAYHEAWKCLGPSVKGDSYVKCSVCVIDFSCAHGGRFDCTRHIKSKSHGEFEKLKEKQTSMKDMFAKSSANKNVSMKRQVAKAETIMCELIAELNVSFSSADKLNSAFKQMFPDSKIAAEMKCGRNKATAVIRELADIRGDNLIARMKCHPFTVSTDGSNDAHSKQYPLVIRTYDSKTKQVNSELLSVPICSGSATGENIFNLIDQTFKNYAIPWENCLALGSDNASVMIGHKKGVYAFAKAKNESIYSAGCTLHLVHIATRKAFHLALPPFDEVLTDIYYYFDKSDKRKSCFKGTQEMFDVQQKRMLKHVCTRWLSIGNALERMLHNWNSLKVYFKEEHSKLKQKENVHVRKSPACGSKVKEASSGPSDKVSACGEKGKGASSGPSDKVPASSKKGKGASSGPSDKVPASSEKGKGASSRPSDKVSASGEKGKFSKGASSLPSDKVSASGEKGKGTSSRPSDKQSANSAPGFSSYAEIKVDNINRFVKSPTNKLYVLFMNYTIKAFNEFLIGMQVEEPKVHMLRRSIHKLIRQILVRFVKPSALTSKTVDKVQYKLQYNIKKNTDLIIGEEATAFVAASEENNLRASKVDEFYENVKAYFTAVIDYLIAKLPLNDPVLCAAEVADINLRMSAKQSDLTFLMERYPCLIPKGSSKDQVMEEFITYQCHDVSEKVKPRLDATWAELSECKDEEGHFLFKNLALVMLGILTVPHSSAHCERIFSCVRKNRTDQRACLGDRSLEALLVVKSAQASQTTAYEYSVQELDRLSSAYYNSVKNVKL